MPEAVFIYHENLKGIDFKALTAFIKYSFGNLRVKIVCLKNEIVKTKGIVFDLLNTHKAFRAVSRDNEPCSIILTNRLVAVEDEFKRLHLRAAIFSQPSVVSLSGIVEAVAKPKKYYFFKKQFESLGIWEIKESWLKKRFKGQFIDYGDSRLTDILKGYISQATFFYMTGNPFCATGSCRLYNSHWQKDLIFSQIKSGDFCAQHKKLLKQIKLK